MGTMITYRGIEMEDIVAIAEKIAREAHAGVMDKSGKPYIGHPERIAKSLSNPMAKAVAWLHDVLEDTDFPESKMRDVLPKEIVDTVLILTHDKKRVPYVDYIMEVKKSKLATEVKLADIDDNSDPSRHTKLPKEKSERMLRKFANARIILKSDKNKFSDF